VYQESKEQLLAVTPHKGGDAAAQPAEKFVMQASDIAINKIKDAAERPRKGSMPSEPPALTMAPPPLSSSMRRRRPAGSGSTGGGGLKKRAYQVAASKMQTKVWGECYRQLIAREDWKAASPATAAAYDFYMGQFHSDVPFARLGKGQATNLIWGSDTITSKCSMATTLRKYYAENGLDNDFPESFVLFADTAVRRSIPQAEKADFVESFLGDLSWSCDESNTILEDVLSGRDASTANGCESPVAWLAKPSNGSSGKGIVVTRNLGELITAAESSEDEEWVLQRYVDNPLLLPPLQPGRKFDIRIWALVTFKGGLKIHMWREGVVRTSSENYSHHDMSDLTKHLTNHGLQEEQSDNFGAFEAGNELFYGSFKALLDERYEGGGRRFDEEVVPSMKACVVRTLLSITKKMKLAAGRKHESFQLFGYDFMLDETFRSWLLEINTAPGAAKEVSF
jgi:tubulin--tyrosine ligase